MPGLPFRIMGGGDKSRRGNNNSNSDAGRSTSRFTYPGNRTPTHPTPPPPAPSSSTQQAAVMSSSNRSVPPPPSVNNNNAFMNSLPGMPARTGNTERPSSLIQQQQTTTQQQQQQQQYINNNRSVLDTSVCSTASAPPSHGYNSNNINNNNNNGPSVSVDPSRNPVFRGTNVNSGIGGNASVAGTIQSTAASEGALPNQTARNAPPSRNNPGPSNNYNNYNNNNNNNNNQDRSTASTGSTSSQTAKPGAFQVTRTTTGPAQVYRVTVPAGVRPGSEFTVHAGPRRVRVRCPATSRPGQSLQITLPPEPVTNYMQLKSAPLTAASGEGGGGAVPMLPDVGRVNEQAAKAGGSAQTYLVTIPPNIYPGMQFTVNVGGQRFMVNCPDSAGPNMRVRIVPPVQREEPEAAPKTQVFEVAVPHGVQPGQPFALVANGQRVLVTCPPNVVPGQKIRFQLPVSQVVGNIQLAYESEKGGWKRTIRVSDLKFQWVRIEAAKEEKQKQDGAQNVDVDAMEHFDLCRAAFVRKITFLEGNDARMRTGKVELAAAHEAVVDSRLIVHNRTLISYADVAVQQTKSFAEKQAWFDGICKQLTTPWEDGHVKICVRRSHLLQDSVDAIMGLGRDDMRKIWRIEFLGEPAIDAGGPAREWFELVTEQVFDPACGLWVASTNNQACVDINTGSALSCPDDHLIYYRFVGRVLGRALFDRQLIRGHMVRMIYKHLLGWPVTIEDIKAQDEEYYHSLKKIMQMEDVSLMCLDFTATEENMGIRTEFELVEGGSMKEVTNENLQDYLEANLRYRVFTRVAPQLTELLLGFFDVVPEPALTVFDANELELMLCGLPEVNLEDWKANTRYKGLFEVKGQSHQVVKWFWEIVEEEFDQEMRARLLQFSTGTSGVPARGFSYLQGIDGNIKKFTIQGVDHNIYMFPKSHTCFNRIDMPDYLSKSEMREKLKIAITTSFVGFDTE